MNANCSKFTRSREAGPPGIPQVSFARPSPRHPRERTHQFRARRSTSLIRMVLPSTSSRHILTAHFLPFTDETADSCHNRGLYRCLGTVAIPRRGPCPKS